MNLKDIQDIVKQFDASSLTEFELRKADFELYLNKNSQIRQNPAVENVVTNNENQKIVDLEQDDTVNQAEGEVIKSPIVGVVYLKPSPEENPYVIPGENVTANQTVCIVEAMKMMNEIPAGRDGIITEVIVKNEQVVGIGEPLFRIK